ncbi:NAD(P)-dependent oxidoreductase [Polynucleobacter sp. Adler-ghost]|uniref:NAD-dependent epimerase/dehydratase family protein n=1 Tax=Polynucleobacter sp. Adler-ghost TaxID=2770234 RepID=UPI001BFDA9A2|nr:NAD-dependent epimerase/dehydratase family protein [Polynucleobacter sp. Adler-ghost]QWE31062.1 NAD-dependent epimerase/dehydratase family protein [Polynucleobacter sp. Adler-ghost]
MEDLTGLNILVIGGTGYLGRHIAARANELGAKVYCVSKNKQPPKKKMPGIIYWKVDITNNAEIEILRNVQFEFVVNASGYVDHTYYKDGGKSVIDMHLIGLFNIISCLDRSRLKRFVQIGSSDEYGKVAAPQKESVREMASTPYAYSKVASTHFIQMLYRSEGFPGVVARLFLIYGPEQESNRLIPQIMGAARGVKQIQFTKGEQIRDFSYIDDVVSGIFKILLGGNSLNGEVINIGSGVAVSVRTIIEMISKIAKIKKIKLGGKEYKENENMQLYPDLSKSKRLLTWLPVVQLEKGLKITWGSINNDKT